MRIKCAICGEQKEINEMHNYVCTECRYKKSVEKIGYPKEMETLFPWLKGDDCA